MDSRDFDERMTAISCDEDGNNRVDVYVRLTTVKGFKQEGDKEYHVDISFVNPCGTFEITDIPLSSLRELINLLRTAYKDYKGIPTIMNFDDVYNDLPAAGWLSRAEADLLWRCCERTTGDILEVGCYKGRSTCLLASFGRQVLCVDPFENFDDSDPTGHTVNAAFLYELNKRSIMNVMIFRQRVEDWTTQPVGLAYLDGDHTYAGTLRQIEVAKRCGARVIAVHDVNDHGDGRMVRKAAIESLGKWDERAERLAAWNMKY